MDEKYIINNLRERLSKQDIFVKSYDVESKIKELIEEQKSKYITDIDWKI